jgi:hypothetical protein
VITNRPVECKNVQPRYPLLTRILVVILLFLGLFTVFCFPSLSRQAMGFAFGIAIATIALAYPQAILGALFVCYTRRTNNCFRCHLTLQLQVIKPNTRTVCHGGQSCLVQWLDDGENPLLPTMGPCYVALFSGNQARFCVCSQFHSN